MCPLRPKSAREKVEKAFGINNGDVYCALLLSDRGIFEIDGQLQATVPLKVRSIDGLQRPSDLSMFVGYCLDPESASRRPFRLCCLTARCPMLAINGSVGMNFTNSIRRQTIGFGLPSAPDIRVMNREKQFLARKICLCKIHKKIAYRTQNRTMAIDFSRSEEQI